MAAVGSLLVARALGLPEAYWATVTTLAMPQSSVDRSLPVAWRRFGGTALGAALGAALGTLLRPSVPLFGAGIFLLGWVCAAVGGAQKAQANTIDKTTYQYAGVTLAVVMLIPRLQAPWVVAIHRFLEVSTGIAVALALTVLWPEKEGTK